jgi:delta-1-pyrroline-5-carboxylate synthetase
LIDAFENLLSVEDSKCDYPSACNAMETLTINKCHMTNGLFEDLCDILKSRHVRVYSGPRLHSLLKFSPPLASSLSKEYSDLELTIEVVDDVSEAINHINTYGSSHTDVIVTEDGKFMIRTSFPDRGFDILITITGR